VLAFSPWGETTTAMGDDGAPRRLAYQPALDGVRALAVLAVIFYHDRTTRLAGGFLGVDVFFVLSGFLITGILLTDHARNGSTLSRQFWVRRARRLMPAFLLMMVIVSAYAAFAPDAFNNLQLRRAGLAAMLYVNNWQTIYASNLRATVVSHTWSLSVEEQWYFVWPFLLAGLLLLARGRHRVLAAAIAVLTVASAVWMHVLAVNVSSSRAFFGTDTRAWELLAGAFLAVVLAKGPPSPTGPARWWLDAAGLLGLAYVLFAFATFDDRARDLYPGARILLVVAVVVLLTAACSTTGPALRHVLGWRPLVAIGLISYGLYLFHPPLFEWLSPGTTGVDGVALLLLRLVVLFTVAFLSYRFLEMPIRRGALRPKVGLVALPIVTVGVALVFVGATARVVTVAPTDFAMAQFRVMADGTPAGTVRLLVAGDETAYSLGAKNAVPFEEQGVRGVTTSSFGCGIVDGTPLIGDQRLTHPDCTRTEKLLGDSVGAYRPDVTALMVGDAEILDREVDGRVLRIGTPEMETYLRGRLDRTARILTGPGRRMILLTVPCADPGPTLNAQWATLRRDRSRTAWLNAVFTRWAADHPRTVTLGRLDQVLCPNGNSAARVGPYPLRSDGITLSPVGARIVWRWLFPTARALDQGRTP
jgi:peptidoglycan/LPS O-acetylase OafA/YrhL